MTVPPVSSLFSRLTAASATLLAGVYAAGFLVVTFRLGEFGVLDLNPFRPQIFLAGALFIVLIAIPAFVALKIIGLIPMDRVESAGMKPVQRKGLYRFASYVGFYTIALGLAGFSGAALLSGSSCFSETRWSFPLLGLMTLSVLISILSRYHFDRFWYLLIPGLLGCQIALFSVLRSDAGKSCFWLTNWFYVAGIATFLLHSTWQKLKAGSEVPWEYLPVYFLALVSLYSTKLYPAIRPQVGGGAPRPVVLYGAGLTPVTDCASANVFLIDETDNGYYLLLRPDDKSGYFIRRETVKAMKFGLAANQQAAAKSPVPCPVPESPVLIE
jgi:hypothetical protein